MQFYNKETGETASNSEIWKLFEESGLDAGVPDGVIIASWEEALDGDENALELLESILEGSKYQII